jgi:cyclopropane fatty-acyl-phospholipid synthase-like methyltransferase
MVYLLFFLMFLSLIFLVVFTAYQIYTNFIQPGAFYYPTTDSDVKKMLKLSKLTPKDTLIDIGSGDGRILIAAARLGATSIGYEISPFLVRRSRRLIRQAKLEKLATVHWKSFWKADFSQATVITVYLFPHLMERLQRLLETKIKKSVKLITNAYPFTQLKVVKKIGRVNLYSLTRKDKDSSK